MTDRELVELAAKAAGVQGEWCTVYLCILRTDTPRGPDGGCDSWNPLTDDGDALRLAVKLRICIAYYADASVEVDWSHAHHRLEQEYDGDPAAATRRAIVRAAAEIAKQGA
jgi:hypothetical protein